jgi:hypothetical protein
MGAQGRSGMKTFLIIVFSLFLLTPNAIALEMPDIPTFEVDWGPIQHMMSNYQQDWGRGTCSGFGQESDGQDGCQCQEGYHNRSSNPDAGGLLCIRYMADGRPAFYRPEDCGRDQRWIEGNDSVGRVTVGVTQDTNQCVIYFREPYAEKPICVANIGTQHSSGSGQDLSKAIIPLGVTVSKNFVGFLTSPGLRLNGRYINYICASSDMLLRSFGE